MADPIGKMLIAKRPCGRISAAAWSDEGGYAYGCTNEELECLALEWSQRGDELEIIERTTPDDMPQWACRECSWGCKEK